MDGGLAFWGYGNRVKALSSALAQGGFKGDSYLEVMDWVAQKAAQTFG